MLLLTHYFLLKAESFDHEELEEYEETINEARNALSDYNATLEEYELELSSLKEFEEYFKQKTTFEENFKKKVHGFTHALRR